MRRHERICFRNPNRTCDICGGKGVYTEVYGDLVEEGDGGLRDDNAKCPFCWEFLFGKKEPHTFIEALEDEIENVN
jgi:hypothetical protein